MNPVKTGAERLRDDHTLIDSGNIGIATNYTAITADLRTTTAALLGSGLDVTALFGPEHGIGGTTQAGHSESDAIDSGSGLPVYDTYRRGGAQLDALLRASGVDVLLYDLQDIGTRFYTYIWTMFDLLTSAARTGVRMVILDRPNPLTGAAVEGPMLHSAFSSFVGRVPIPIRHGLTVGELARHLNTTAVADEVGHPADVAVIEVSRWYRSAFGDETGLPWVMPSINIPTLDSALVYPGTGLFEGTNLSEGRGTTRPFELIGAPYVDARWAAELNARDLPGVRFRDVSFRPTFHKHVDTTVRGVQLYIDDRGAFAPVRTALEMLHTLKTLYPRDFGWRVAAQGAEATTHRHFIDLLWGGDTLRRCLDNGDHPGRLLEAAPRDHSWVAEGSLLYN